LTGATAPGLTTFGCAPAQLLQTACREIARLHSPAAADLTGFTVVVPDLHAVPALARALQSAFDRPVLLLPRIVTLRSWAADVALDREVVSATVQESVLYQLLAERRWLHGADLWAVATELTFLFAELTRWQVELPAAASDLKARLDAAYCARAGASFGFEARLIHELWHASHSGAAIDAESAYLHQLAQLATAVREPVYALRLVPFAPAEEAFLRRCAVRVPVCVFAPDASLAAEPLERMIAHAWPHTERADLPLRAREFSSAFPQSPLGGKLRFFAAAHAESHAQAVDAAVRRWLGEGCESIAVIVLDRVVARRARALLERSEILVRDEAGWAMSTTSAATVIGRWLDTLASDHAYEDCLDLLKSPFVFHDFPRRARQQAVWRLEQAIRRNSVRSGIARYLRLAERDDDRELHQLLSRVARAERMMARNRRKTIRAWLQALEESLAELGVHAGLAADAAGVELLAALDMLKTELETDALRLSFAEWRSWLARKIEAATFRDRGIESPVTFTTLQATRLRHFDAVLLLGADAAHLPGPEPISPFFNQSVRRELGLPVRSDALREIEQCLGTLVVSCSRMLITWQRSVKGEENLLSPLLERLRTFHELAWRDDLQETGLADALVANPPSPEPARSHEERARPAPSIPPPLVPAAISASGYNTLMACPYKFFARYALKLAEADEVREEIDKSDYGERVHAILEDFHRAHPRVSSLDRSGAERILIELSERSFRDLIEHDYQSAAWLARWLALVPEYIEWQRNREAQGWRFSAGESDRSITIETPSRRTFVLRGRIDRVDERTDGACAMVDYKTSAPLRLRRALEVPGEDVQLPVYALLWGGEVAAALFLSIDREGVVPVALSGDVDALVAATRARLARLYDAIADGAALPAQGSDEVCQYCEFQGLCRRKYWCD
jgi:ATP-dependent helicase/nuclease subunit B